MVCEREAALKEALQRERSHTLEVEVSEMAYVAPINVWLRSTLNLRASHTRHRTISPCARVCPILQNVIQNGFKYND